MFVCNECDGSMSDDLMCDNWQQLLIRMNNAQCLYRHKTVWHRQHLLHAQSNNHLKCSLLLLQFVVPTATQAFFTTQRSVVCPRLRLANSRVAQVTQMWHRYSHLFFLFSEDPEIISVFFWTETVHDICLGSPQQLSKATSTTGLGRRKHFIIFTLAISTGYVEKHNMGVPQQMHTQFHWYPSKLICFQRFIGCPSFGAKPIGQGGMVVFTLIICSHWWHWRDDPFRTKCVELSWKHHPVAISTWNIHWVHNVCIFGGWFKTWGRGHQKHKPYL